MQTARGQLMQVVIGFLCWGLAWGYFLLPPASKCCRGPGDIGPGMIRTGQSGAGDLTFGFFWVFQGCGCFLCANLGRQGRIHTMKVALATLCFNFGVGVAMSFAAYCIIDKTPLVGAHVLVYHHWFYFAPNVTSETNFIVRMLARLVIQSLVMTVFFAASFDFIYVVNHAITFVVIGFGLMLLILMRRRRLQMAAALVDQDVAKYAAIWEELQNEQLQTIDALSTQARAICSGCSADGPRQPCTDIDELYKQAERLQLLFTAKATKWAGATAGKLHVGPVKKGTRAIQKIVRSYSGDVSRLFDLCRGCISFPDLEMLRKALELIATDPEVEVLRLKNRFDRDYDSSRSAGYRDACLILRLVNDETRHMGVEGHCCELQLHVHKLFSAKTDGGHARYVKWRNMRCE